MQEEVILQELDFKAVRSSGAGGQHVNKTASKVALYFNVENSAGLDSEEKIRISRKLKARLTRSGELILRSSSTRSQHKNKQEVIGRFLDLVKGALKKPKPRKKTRPTNASKLKRLREKKIRSEKKSQRQNPLK